MSASPITPLGNLSASNVKEFKKGMYEMSASPPGQLASAATKNKNSKPKFFHQMVVLAASVCTKTGKALVSRQFIDMSRSRIEGLLASFPKLAQSSDQHTFVETETVRFVYQPLDALYMVLITNKTSNILQDIDTLHLFARAVGEYCRTIDEKEIIRQAFELLAVFDEIISLGYRENVNLGQLRTISAMESNEERIQAEIKKNKEKEAKEELKRKAKILDNQKREAAKNKYSSGGGFGSSYSSSGYGGSGSSYQQSGRVGNQSYDQPSSNQYGNQQFSVSGGSFATSSTPAFSATQSYSSGKGMQLGSKNKQSSLFETIKNEEGLRESTVHVPVVTQSVQQPVSPVSVVPEDNVHVVVEEKVSCQMNRDGGLASMELNGTILLKVNDQNSARCRVVLSHGNDVQFKTHPNIDKQLWSAQSMLGLKDPSRPYPLSQPLGILRWRLQTTDESKVPLTVNCWPSPTGHGCDVNIEYELNTSIVLEDVLIRIPYGNASAPTVSDAEGDYKIDNGSRCILWSLPLIDTSNSSGVLEFSVPGMDDTSAFFPINVSFRASSPLTQLQVKQVTLIDGGSANYSLQPSLTTDSYQIV